MKCNENSELQIKEETMQKRQKQKWTIFVFSNDDSKFDIFSSKTKKVKHKDKDKSGCERKKTKSIFVFSNDYSKFHIF